MTCKRRKPIEPLKCAEKTAKGNVFAFREEAEERARRTAAATGDPVHAYACPECGKWHIGRNSRREARRYHAAWPTNKTRGGAKDRAKKIKENQEIRKDDGDVE